MVSESNDSVSKTKKYFFILEISTGREREISWRGRGMGKRGEGQRTVESKSENLKKITRFVS